jgi:hypothetical protein
MDSVGIHMPTRKIREFSTSSMSNALRHSPSARCVTAANDMQILGTFLAKALSLRTPFRCNKACRLSICI